MFDRRQMLAGLAMLSGACLAVRSAGAQPAGGSRSPMPGMTAGAMTARECVESCWRSHVACLETERYCLEMGGVHVTPAHLALLADCAEMCGKTADTLLRRSSQHAAVCTACAELCDACAGQCEAFKDDERMQLCAKTCRDCAGHCREMSKLPI